MANHPNDTSNANLIRCRYFFPSRGGVPVRTVRPLPPPTRGVHTRPVILSPSPAPKFTPSEILLVTKHTPFHDRIGYPSPSLHSHPLHASFPFL